MIDANQRIKMLQIALQFTLPRMKQATNKVSEDLPLFINRQSSPLHLNLLLLEFLDAIIKSS